MSMMQKWRVTLKAQPGEAETVSSEPLFAVHAETALAIARAKYGRDDVDVTPVVFDVAELFQDMLRGGAR